ncbi:oxidoreductase [Streptomyces lunaelactis]|uniref:WD40/YVTN/BNR-like repeat-containing protein n=1 Tax=Streptomyces lunaelactis TaxID=1535768 RepID=UPI001584A2F3|nr:oxidoreductase [Streptomyces lunaelactis]NUK04865.1 oxidoreductase [Streptomyces lunaelactis]NUK11599.1 oxidoreductase [Streptomyces lunaelactis]NUK19262.1 oxidoreductase [Streptomyces lunaelactis]NUK22999.1 oxidoreductase [Streptomyces lunaelactis]NUK54225.1 oxidoreductase [Streptomyces lunaelactis]
MTSMGKTRRMVSVGLCAAAVAAALAAPAQAAGQSGSTAAGGSGKGPSWSLKDTGTDVRFRGLAPVSRRTAWVAGSKGTVLRTPDGGRSWQNVSPAGAGELEFRDIEAFDDRRAVVLAIGEGEASRVLRTEDGGASWTESFRNTDPKAFYDCITFFDSRHGLAMSDPVDGRFRILSTDDGGTSWKVLPSAGMPAALPGEAGFAASGQCLVSSGSRDVWLATGGGATARVLHSADRGLNWTVAESTIPAGDPARGVFGLAFRDRTHGIAAGGDYRGDQASPQAAAVSGDGGRSWRQSRTPPPAYRSGVAWLPHSSVAALAVGPTGTDLTVDGGRNWRTVDTGSYDTVDCTPDFGCWASGEKGRVARLEF